MKMAQILFSWHIFLLGWLQSIQNSKTLTLPTKLVKPKIFVHISKIKVQL